MTNLEEVIEKKSKLKAIVYIDYDNVLERFSSLNVTVEQLNFFETLKEEFEKRGVYISDIIAYANFEKSELFSVSHQTQLQRKGIQTRHCSNDGKNAGDLEMAVDTIVELYKNPTIQAFIIVSNDRDLIPLLKAIKKEDKLAIYSCSKKGLNGMVSNYADFTLYFEDIFELPERNGTEGTAIERANNIDVERLNDTDKENAKKVAELLYKSRLWTSYQGDHNQVIKLQGYALQVAKILSVLKNDAIKYYEIAHKLEFVELYVDAETEQVCIRDGAKKDEI
ncbi:NYN domain-containing protein [Bacillus manliponensis]|uniref:NYN domain-containing protein n=1 Tax=Bacillus manliponensis TaxID=574376 RepID=UPI003517949C